MQARSPQAKYQDRLRHLDGQLQSLKRKDTQLSYLRLISFLVLVALFILALQYLGWLSLLYVLVAVALFGKLIHYHEALQGQMHFIERSQDLNRRELRGLDFDFAQNYSGIDFREENHPYESDLDIFGDHSIFQYLVRAQTRPGREMLAHWLKAAAKVDEILQRQEAIQELTPNLDFRQAIWVEADKVDDDQRHLANLGTWLQSPDHLRHRLDMKILKIVLPPLVIIGMVAIGNYITMSLVWLPLVVPGYLLWRSHQAITQMLDRTEKIAEALTTYSRILSRIEETSFVADLLTEGKDNLETGGIKASKQIRKLSYRIRQLSVRQNFFGIFFNLFFLWDFHWVVALEKSKAELAPVLSNWLETLSLFEALNSLATFSFNHPTYAFPKLNDTTLSAQDLGHPLIPDAARITNPIQVGSEKHIMLITGSNMAGKSTYLRTVGVNLILAGAGAPVCAATMSFDPRPIYTSMRVADALEDGASSFYAELAKLKRVIDAVQENPRIIFLLDEILKGTNSGDRHKGSEALLRQLIKVGGVGLVATHDLALTEMERSFPGQIENWYFDVVIEEGKLAFDYKIKRGICQSFNATILMQQMGIEVAGD